MKNSATAHLSVSRAKACISPRIARRIPRRFGDSDDNGSGRDRRSSSKANATNNECQLFRMNSPMTIRTWTRPFAAGSILVAILVALFALPLSPALGQGAGVEVDQPPIPQGIDVFNLDLRQTRAFSRSLNFKVVGHSYLKGPHLAPGPGQRHGRRDQQPPGPRRHRLSCRLQRSAHSLRAAHRRCARPQGHEGIELRPVQPGDTVSLSAGQHQAAHPGRRASTCPARSNPIQPRGGPSKAKVGVSFTDVSRPKSPSLSGSSRPRRAGPPTSSR